MRANGSEVQALESTAQRHTRLLFDRMRRYAARIAKKTEHQDVHRFRTHSRRVEALITEFLPDSRNKRKLMKRLSKLRNKAGKLRDLDVQISLLKELKIPDRQNHRSQLLEILGDRRIRRSKKLAAAFNAKKVVDLRKRLRRAESELKLEGLDPMPLAFRHLPKPGHQPISEKVLHSCRVTAKRSRYLAELSDSAPAKSFVEELKRAQDVIGEWHDIFKLKEIAEEQFGGAPDSALVAALQNIGRARFRRAVTALLSALSALESHRTEFESAARKSAASDQTVSTAAVA